jgi:hypothetical protein
VLESVFFTQTPSFLAFQRTMEKSKGRSNVQTLFGVHQIPSDNHIRDLLDRLKPALVAPVFEQAFEMPGKTHLKMSESDKLSLRAKDGHDQGE